MEEVNDEMTNWDAEDIVTYFRRVRGAGVRLRSAGGHSRRGWLTENSSNTSKGFGERGALFRACFACLSKVLVFCGIWRCTSKGYVERETSLASLKRERESLFQGLLCLPLKSAGFCGKSWCTSKGYGERETSLALLEREGVAFSGLALLASQKCWFLWQIVMH